MSVALWLWHRIVGAAAPSGPAPACMVLEEGVPMALMLVEGPAALMEEELLGVVLEERSC